MQWPGSLCDSKKRCCFQDTGKPAAEFGIHGLWPQYTTCRPAAGDRDGDGAAAAFNIILGSTVGKPKKKCYPEDCDEKDKLDLLQIKDLLAALERDWPTLSCKNGATNMDFWGHEWQKHGTCSAFDQHRYFQRSLELKAAHNLTAILADAGIVPSDSATYFLSGVKDAIRRATGFDAIVECNRNTAGEAQLYQVYLCVARDGSGLVDCPEPLLRNCADKIKFPAF